MPSAPGAHSLNRAARQRKLSQPSSRKSTSRASRRGRSMTWSRRWAVRAYRRARSAGCVKVRRIRNRSRIDFPPHDERVHAFLNRPIEGEWPYLWIDATYIKSRKGGRIVSTGRHSGCRSQCRRQARGSGPRHWGIRSRALLEGLSEIPDNTRPAQREARHSQSQGPAGGCYQSAEHQPAKMPGPLDAQSPRPGRQDAPRRRRRHGENGLCPGDPGSRPPAMAQRRLTSSGF